MSRLLNRCFFCNGYPAEYSLQMIPRDVNGIELAVYETRACSPCVHNTAEAIVENDLEGDILY